MNKKLGDIILLLIFALLVLIFFLPSTFLFYKHINSKFPILLSFLKFALLATYGEIISYRIKNKIHIDKNFGIFPKMIIWGILGIFIWFAFQIFYNGSIKGIIEPMQKYLLNINNYYSQSNKINFNKIILSKLNNFFYKLSLNKIFISFTISFFMNIFFAPVMMLTHNLTDLHIAKNNGKFIISKFKILELIKEVNWNKMWGFVFKKTIPFFWVPAHTITFLLPQDFRILFAAILSIILGILLSLKRN
ncbi:MAG: hypothetical protein N3A58_00890 [Spirochaetes bacterium]|nr:hypothetical protein [Spirochaetota bacterium]